MGQTWLVGASVPVGPALLVDGIEEVRDGVNGKEKSGRLLFISPFSGARLHVASLVSGARLRPCGWGGL